MPAPAWRSALLDTLGTLTRVLRFEQTRHRDAQARAINDPVCLPEDFLQESRFDLSIVGVALVIDGDRRALVFEDGVGDNADA